ncbi:MAG: NAD(P)-dependent oxidoreductase [Alphaproteobacteria bacterium]|nr:NAD(P)-dependent oxidoreductase [Alphaproteobacteria bacterium]MDX5369461.1 NAD(P)-dependent oxidoreductase [Alphaproteobacteria bacterium]MDX5464139.1 NAD(P)-dependent oxidoreductase [Alphaproteobacteria bacterium]
MQVGYIGLGNMGGALAERLQKTMPLHVHDRSQAAMDRLGAAGATPCATAREVAERCDLVLTCLQTSAQVREVVFGAGGLAEGLRPGTIVVDQTTGDPFETRKLQAEVEALGAHFMDAPVSGGPPGAAAGTIAIMAGAPADLYARAEPVLRAISSNVYHTGDVGSGHVMKLANNLLAASQRLLTHEIMCLAVRNGVAPETAVEVMRKGSGRNYTLDNTYPRHILTGELFQGFTLALMHKDVALAVDMAKTSAVPLFFGAQVREHYQAAINEFGAEADVNEAVRLFERMSKTRVRPQA